MFACLGQEVGRAFKCWYFEFPSYLLTWNLLKLLVSRFECLKGDSLIPPQIRINFQISIDNSNQISFSIFSCLTFSLLFLIKNIFNSIRVQYGMMRSIWKYQKISRILMRNDKIRICVENWKGQIPSTRVSPFKRCRECLASLQFIYGASYQYVVCDNERKCRSREWNSVKVLLISYKIIESLWCSLFFQPWIIRGFFLLVVFSTDSHFCEFMKEFRPTYTTALLVRISSSRGLGKQK